MALQPNVQKPKTVFGSHDAIRLKSVRKTIRFDLSIDGVVLDVLKWNFDAYGASIKRLGSQVPSDLDITIGDRLVSLNDICLSNKPKAVIQQAWDEAVTEGNVVTLIFESVAALSAESAVTREHDPGVELDFFGFFKPICENCGEPNFSNLPQYCCDECKKGGEMKTEYWQPQVFDNLSAMANMLRGSTNTATPYFPLKIETDYVKFGLNEVPVPGSMVTNDQNKALKRKGYSVSQLIQQDYIYLAFPPNFSVYGQYGRNFSVYGQVNADAPCRV